MTKQDTKSVKELIHSSFVEKYRGIQLTGEIDIDMAEMVQHLSQFYIYQPASKKPVIGCINSPGGSVYQALAIYDELVNLGEHVATVGHVKGICMSAATVVLQAFHKRVASKHSTFMLHEVFHASAGVLSAQEAANKEAVRMQKLMTALVQERLTVPIKSLKMKTGVNKYLSPETALEVGLIDEIV